MSSHSKSNRRGRSTKPNNRSVDSLIVASSHSAAKGDVVFNTSDLSRSQPRWALTQTPPRNFLTQIVWLQEQIEASFTQPATGGFSELACTFFLAAAPGAVQIAALYDQYCIYSIAFRCVPELSNAQPISGTGQGTIGQLITALDYDSSGTLGSWNAYQDFGSAQEYEAVPGKSYERYIKPVCPLVTGSSNSTSNSGVALGRMWLNSSTPNVPHFGVRVAAQGNTSQVAVTYRLIFTYVIGMRNNF